MSPRKAPPPRGRGAVSNPAGRFERFSIEASDDAPEPEAGSTIVTAEKTRTIITRNDSPDIPFDRSINPYKGCEHGCIYCFARPTHAYLGLSPGLDFETRIFSKPDASSALRRELARPGYRCAVIALGSNTDPYQPAERRLGITRALLEVLQEHGHPVSIVTKSDAVLRDLDIITRMASRRLASVMISITTLDRRLARTMEPRAASPPRRLETIRRLAEAKVPVGVLASPMIPGLNDAHLERILEASAAAGAGSAGYILLRLPGELRELFAEWLGREYPLRKEKVLSLVRQTRDGRLSDSTFGRRMVGAGPVADALRARFHIAIRRHGLRDRAVGLDTTQFEVPGSGGQRSLF